MRDSYARAKKISLRETSGLDEQWVQKIISDDPSILGLGELAVRGKERRQLSNGRLDLLLEDPNGERRYEVELQLGKTDPSHIIRSLEYWDLERKRYPYYEHFAVLVAEDISSRFLNVISLFNGTVPFIAIQMGAYEIGDKITLVFTKVMNAISSGPEDDRDDAIAAAADREFWENKATKKTVGLVDRVLEILQGFDPELELNYTKPYIGLAKGGKSCNFVTLVPQKKSFILRVYLPKNEELDAELEEAGLEMSGSGDQNHYSILLDADVIKSKSEDLKKLSRQAYDRRFGK